MEVDARLVIECSFGGGVERKSLRLFRNSLILWVTEKYEFGQNLIRAMAGANWLLDPPPWVNLAGIHTVIHLVLKCRLNTLSCIPLFLLFQNSSNLSMEI